MIRMFRYIGLAEGITTLALFLVAMPAKYWLAYPHLVPPVGLIHGVAFVAYILAMVVCLWGGDFQDGNGPARRSRRLCRSARF